MEVGLFWVAYTTQEASKRLIVIQNLYPDTIAPRTLRGAISDIYRMMIAETKPTPKPAMRRPAIRKPYELDAI